MLAAHHIASGEHADLASYADIGIMKSVFSLAARLAGVARGTRTVGAATVS